jgi:hypothetical protein
MTVLPNPRRARQPSQVEPARIPQETIDALREHQREHQRRLEEIERAREKLRGKIAPKSTRKPSLATIAKQLAKAGVAGFERDGVKVFLSLEPSGTAAEANPWDAVLPSERLQ